MGLFDLFTEVKYCPICQEEISIAQNIRKMNLKLDAFNPFSGFGHVKLIDGEIVCKKCATKASPFYYPKDKTLPDFKKHLRQRDENLDQLYFFHVSKEYGECDRLYIDETNHEFFVCDSTSYFMKNPDIIQGYQIRSIKQLISKNRKEIQYETGNGMKSYNPIQYKYIFDFKLKIELDHPYIHSLVVNIRKEPLVFENPYVDGRKPGLFSPKYPTYRPDEWDDHTYRKYESILEEMEKSLMKIKRESKTIPHIPKEQPQFSGTICPWCQSVSKQSIYENCKCCGGPLSAK